MTRRRMLGRSDICVVHEVSLLHTCTVPRTLSRRFPEYRQSDKSVGQYLTKEATQGRRHDVSLENC